jgi:hypothetical protein
MDRTCFLVGDRVRLRRPIPWMAAGTCGTIILDYLWVLDWYDVRFEPGRRIRPVHASDLELLASRVAHPAGADAREPVPELN